MVPLPSTLTSGSKPGRCSSTTTACENAIVPAPVARPARCVALGRPAATPVRSSTVPAVKATNRLPGSFIASLPAAAPKNGSVLPANGDRAGCRLLTCRPELSDVDEGMFQRCRQAASIVLAVLVASATLTLAGCGSATTVTETTSLAAGAIPKAHPQAIDPTAGAQAPAVTPQDPIGDPHAHATPLSVATPELAPAHVAVSVNN